MGEQPANVGKTPNRHQDEFHKPSASGHRSPRASRRAGIAGRCTGRTRLGRRPDLARRIATLGSGPCRILHRPRRVDPLWPADDPQRLGRPRDLRARRALGLAHPPGRAAPGGAVGVGLTQEWGQPGPGDPPRRRRVVPSGRQALARRRSVHGTDPPGGHRHRWTARTSNWMEKVSDEQYTAPRRSAARSAR